MLFGKRSYPFYFAQRKFSLVPNKSSNNGEYLLSLSFNREDMEEDFDIRDARMPESEREYENALRPLSFHDFSGQAKVVENLKVFVMAARMRKEALDHVLLHGPPGLGKTTLSNIIANELGVGFKVTSGPVLDKPGDLAPHYAIR